MGVKKRIPFAVLSATILATSLSTGVVQAAEDSANVKATSVDKNKEVNDGKKATATTGNTSKPIDFNKAKKMSPDQLEDQLTKKDKQINDGDINENGSVKHVRDGAGSPRIQTFSAMPSSSVNSYIKKHNFKPATITQDRRMNNLPKYNYKSKKPIGVVIHETANPYSTLNGEVNYMYNNWRNAFVHGYVDRNEIRQTAPFNYLSWGAGPVANPYYINIELVREHTFDGFAKSVNNDAYLVAYLLKQNGLKPSLADNNYGKGTILSHNGVSKYYGGTDHTDPISYFASWGYDMNQFYDLVKYHYDNLTNASGSKATSTKAATTKIVGTAHKVKPNETLWNISMRSGVSISNIKKWNNLTSNNIEVNQVLRLTAPKIKTTKITTSTYKVAKNDTLYNISRRSGQSIDDIKQWNGLKTNQIKIGQTLYLRPAHKVVSGETLYRIATSNNMSVTKLKQLNGLKSNTIYVGQMLKLQ